MVGVFRRLRTGRGTTAAQGRTGRACRTRRRACRRGGPGVFRAGGGVDLQLPDARPHPGPHQSAGRPAGKQPAAQSGVVWPLRIGFGPGGLERVFPPWRENEAARYGGRVGGDLLGQGRLRVHAHPPHAGAQLASRTDRGARASRGRLTAAQAQRAALGARIRGFRKFSRQTLPRRKAVFQRGRRGSHDPAQRVARSLPGAWRA